MSKVLYPGSFDPITKGHMNIIEQASELFDEVIVAVMQNSSKSNGMFSLEERVRIISELYERYNNIRVVTGNGQHRMWQLPSDRYCCRSIQRHCVPC